MALRLRSRCRAVAAGARRAIGGGAAVSPRTVSYSRCFTLVPTYDCFNSCSYCNFRTDLGKSPWLPLEEAAATLEKIRGEVDEVLILSGEVHPRAKNRTAWHEHILALCRLALDRGFLPHCNVGPLSFAEMESLAEVNPSMGLMLEQVVPLAVHRFAPSKDPALRIEQLRHAGRLGLPFTTGLLLGLGESAEDRLAGLEAIAASAREFGHIQEVILQPFSPGERDSWRGSDFRLQDLPPLVREARSMLPEDVVIQVPPNLFVGAGAEELLLQCLEQGASDLGGISPLDEVNPSYGFPSSTQLQGLLGTRGFHLRRRLCIHEGKMHLLERQGRLELLERVRQHPGRC